MNVEIAQKESPNENNENNETKRRIRASQRATTRGHTLKKPRDRLEGNAFFSLSLSGRDDNNQQIDVEKKRT